MATYVNDLRLKEISTGDESGTWGTSTNTNLELIGEALGYATEQSFGSDADATTTVADGVSDPARAMYFKVTSAVSLTATRTLTIAPNTVSRVMFIENATSGSQSIAISQGSGANVTIATGKTAIVYLDGAGAGAAVVDAMAGVDPGVTDTLAEVLTAGNATGGTDIAVGAGDDVTFSDSSKAIFGVGSDLQIYHDGTDSYITEVGNGNLIVRAAGGALFQGATAGESLLTLLENGAVTAYYDNAAKLATTSTGIDVTGTVVSDGLTSSGNVLVATTNAGATGLSVSNSSTISFAEGASSSVANIFRQSSSADSVLASGYKYTDTANRMASSTASTWAKSAVNVGYGYVRFFTDAASTDSVGTDLTPTERMRIDSSGRLGIGTASPDALLRVNGTAKIGEGAASNTAKLMVNTASGVAAGIQLFQDGNESWIIQNPASTTALTFANSGTERFSIDSSGNATVKAAGELRIRDDGTFIKEDQGLQIGNTSGTGTTRPIRFFTESAERMRIDSGGGINKVAGSGATLPAIAAGLLTGEFKGSADSAVTNDSGFLRLSAGGGTTVGVKAGIDIFRGATDGSLIRMFTNGSEALRLDSSRNLLVGSTNNSNETDEGFKLKPNGEGTNKPRLSISTAGYQTETCLSIYSTAVTAFRFYVDAAGTISAVNTSITSISDERVKENVRDLDDGLDKVLQLQPRKFDWKQGQGRDISNDRGFIAQEFEQVFPDMIEEWKDKAPEGEEPYKAINANLIPTLVKAIQEQQETITALEARISQLEND